MPRGLGVGEPPPPPPLLSLPALPFLARPHSQPAARMRPARTRKVPPHRPPLALVTLSLSAPPQSAALQGMTARAFWTLSLLSSTPPSRPPSSPSPASFPLRRAADLAARPRRAMHPFACAPIGRAAPRAASPPRRAAPEGEVARALVGCVGGCEGAEVASCSDRRPPGDRYLTQKESVRSEPVRVLAPCLPAREDLFGGLLDETWRKEVVVGAGGEGSWGAAP